MRNKRVYQYLLPLSLVFITASCTEESEGLPHASGEEQTLRLGFSVASDTDDSSPTAENEKNGVGLENKLDINPDGTGNYKILLFDTDNKFMSEFKPKNTIVTESDGYTNYNFSGTFPEYAIANTAFKIVVLANWPTYPTNFSTLEDLCDNESSQFNLFSSFELSDGTGGKDKNLIPFYGVRSFSEYETPATDGVVNLTGKPISLLRAVAKVQIDVVSEERYTISTPVINNYNTKGFCAPDCEYNEGDSDYPVHPVEDVATSGNLEMMKLPDFEDGGKKFESWVAYIPEYRNLPTEDVVVENPTSIKLHLDGNTLVKDVTLHYAHRDSGAPMPTASTTDLRRNCYYHFVISSIKEGEVDWKLVAEPWNGRNHIEIVM